MNEDLIEGLKKLKIGALIYLSTPLLLLIGFILTMLSFMWWMMTPNYTIPIPQTNDKNITPGSEIYVPLDYSILLIPLIIFLLFVALFIIAFIMWLMASIHFKRHKPSLAIGEIGMILQIFAIMALFGIFFQLILSGEKDIMTHAWVSWITIAIFLLFSIGGILFAEMLIRLSRETNLDPEFKTIGIIHGLAMIFVPLTVISCILIYISSKKSIKNLQAPSGDI